jgi:hypothetical protein
MGFVKPTGSVIFVVPMSRNIKQKAFRVSLSQRWVLDISLSYKLKTYNRLQKTIESDSTDECKKRLHTSEI